MPRMKQLKVFKSLLINKAVQQKYLFKHCFCYLKVENVKQKNSLFHQPTPITIGDVTNIFAISSAQDPDLFRLTFFSGHKSAIFSLKIYGLLTKHVVHMGGYWPSSFLLVYGPRRT